MKRTVALLLLLTLTVHCCIPTCAGTAKQFTSSDATVVNESRISDREHIAEEQTPAENDIGLSMDNCMSCRNGAQKGKDSVLFAQEDSAADFSFELREDSDYYIKLVYFPDSESNIGSSNIGIKINGDYPFDEAKEINLSWRWNNAKRKKDSRGNEILDSMNVNVQETVSFLNDASGEEKFPMRVHFPKGKNTISVIANTGNFTLKQIKLIASIQVGDYRSYIDRYTDKKVTSGQKIVLQAEDYDEASSAMLTPNCDKSDANTTPNDAVFLVYNYIPQEKYCNSGQWLKWEFVPEQTGFYEISMRVRQNVKSGFTVARRLYIDGQVPFDECNEINFNYANHWYVQEIGDANPFQFYFEKGKNYTLTLEVTPGSLSEITKPLNDLIYELNSLYRNAVMIAGNDTDLYRDYQLDKVIPNFKETLSELYDQTDKLAKKLEQRNSGKSGNALTSFHSMLNRLRKIQKDPDILAKELSAYQSCVQSLSAWNQDAKNQPLDVDSIIIHSPDVNVQKQKIGFFGQMLFSLKRIISSFGDDYGKVGDVYDKESSLDIWISTGREQMNILKRLVDNSFAQTGGIKTNLSLVTVDIRTAVLAGTAPDVSLFTSGDMPVNLAIRGALSDLSKFDDFKEVAKRFGDHAMTPFEYRGGCYALPISETFNMLFVRTDVFEELGVSVPETWEDFYRVATILQRNNLEVGIPANIGMFATLLFQKNGNFYNESFSGTDFDSDAAVEAFSMWTGLFARYGFPLSYDFYNRFRSGEMPMAIVDYTQYLKVAAASPEISGRWEMRQIPGTLMPDGGIDRSLSVSSASGGDTSPGLAQSITSAIVYSASNHQKEAWEFLKWFTSADVQTSYGREIEQTLGSISRYTPANTEAFKNLPWKHSERILLEEQRDQIRTLNEMPGNYGVTRELINGFRKVVYENSNPTDTIHAYNRKINKELFRKAEK